MDWNAAYGIDSVSSVEDTDFAAVSFRTHFLTVLISAFDFDEVLAAGEFRDDRCVFRISLNSLPPTTPTDEAGNPRWYYTAIYAWRRSGRTFPERTEIELDLSPARP